MTSKAHVEFDLTMMGVQVAVTREYGGVRQALRWPPVEVVTLGEATAGTVDESLWLRLPEADARAIYEALADYFGHAGHDIRALRKDYDAERGRVDRLIAHLTTPTDGGAK